MTRRVKRPRMCRWALQMAIPLLINEASLHDLRQRCPAGIKLEQFRPNLVVTGASPSGGRQLVGGAYRRGDFRCAETVQPLCVHHRQPERGRKHPSGEPLATLQKFRSATDGSGDIDFGLNLVARNSGIVRAGDEVQVLAQKPPRPYGAAAVVETLEVESQSEASVAISWQGETFGNNQQILLEQLEMKGYKIPYSCRAGICGSCKITLVEGKVRAMKKGAIRADGTILSCSCIPDGNLVLAK